MSQLRVSARTRAPDGASIDTEPKPGARFNPGRFSDALTQDFFPTGFGAGTRRGFESQALIEWLTKKHGEDKRSVDLAARLQTCKIGRRCQSLACPKCSAALQALSAATIGSFLSSHLDREKIVCVSVVPHDGEIPKGNLSADQHQRATRRWKDRLGRADVPWFLGATDWSFNQHQDERYEPAWQEHFYGFTVTDDPRKLKKRLLGQFSATDAIPRPVRVTTWDGDLTAIDYMLKPMFWRRIGTDEGSRFAKTLSGKRECRATDKQPLKSSEKRELLLHLDEIGI